MENREENAPMPMQGLPAAEQNEEIKNIVGQIDPQRILENLNHALRGEYFSKETGQWEKVGEELINDKGRGWIISFFTSILNNASTMGTINEKQFSFLMEGVIMTITKEFRCNLEKFGFVPRDKSLPKGVYENKGTPDTSRMNTITEMVYQRAFLIYSRSLAGSESKRIFKSLSLSDSMGHGDNNAQKKNFINRVFGG